ATFSSPVSDNGTGSIIAPISADGLLITATSNDLVNPAVTKLVLGVHGESSASFNLVIQASVNGVTTTPPPQTLSYRFSGSIQPPPAGDSAAMETWIDNSNMLFGTAGAGIVADTGPQPVDLVGGTTSTGSLSFGGTVPYALTTQVAVTVF